MKPCKQEIERVAKLGIYDVIPVSMELYADCITPMEVMRKLKQVSTHCFLLESVETSNKWGRYTFLGYDPILELTCKNHELTITSAVTIRETVKHPKEYIRKILSEYKSPKFPELPPFTGGLVGYFAYEYIKYCEPTLAFDSEKDEEKKDSFHDVDLMLFDKVIAFDHEKQKIILIVNVRTKELETNYQKAKFELKKMASLITQGEKKKEEPLALVTPFQPLFEKEAFCEMVESAKKHIYEGDIFQVVVSNLLKAQINGSLLDTYRVLRTTNPSPYMFYFTSDELEIAGASPETLVKFQENKVYTFPLAGTRPRGRNEVEDEELEKELLSDTKELAEHNMLVDLGRNDIGKVSKIGSVAVKQYMSIERFSHVMHIGSTVEGVLSEGKDALDAVDAILPAGTLSGAPKIRACEIIHQLEKKERGVYGGALGYIDFTGSMDLCISIRLAYKKNGYVYVRSGAGIVADSIPSQEYEECIHKAKAVMNAIKQSEGGIDDDFTD